MAEARTKVVTPMFRVSYPSVFTAKAFEDGKDPTYSTVALFEPAKFTAEEKKLWKAMQTLADEQAVEAFKIPVAKFGTKYLTPFRDGAEREDTDGYGEGVVFMTLSSKQKPGLIGRDRQPILSMDEFYAGCYARATVTCYWYPKKADPKKKKGVAFGLQNVQKVKEGEPFSSRTPAEDDFKDDLGDDDGFMD